MGEWQQGSHHSLLRNRKETFALISVVNVGHCWDTWTITGSSGHKPLSKDEPSFYFDSHLCNAEILWHNHVPRGEISNMKIRMPQNPTRGHSQGHHSAQFIVWHLKLPIAVTCSGKKQLSLPPCLLHSSTFPKKWLAFRSVSGSASGEPSQGHEPTCGICSHRLGAGQVSLSHRCTAFSFLLLLQHYHRLTDRLKTTQSRYLTFCGSEVLLG